MTENDGVQDLDVSSDESENVTGGYATPHPVQPVVPGTEETVAAKEAGVKNTVRQLVTPMHPNN